MTTATRDDLIRELDEIDNRLIAIGYYKGHTKTETDRILLDKRDRVLKQIKLAGGFPGPTA